MAKRTEVEGRPLLDEDNDSSEDERSLAQTGLYPSVNDSDDDRSKSLDVQRRIVYVYKRRWYILIVFSFFSMTFSTVWNCFGPIAISAKVAFNWDDSTIAFLTNLGPIGYMVTGFLYPWLLQEKGLRWTVLSALLISGIGNTLRSISSEPKTATILMHVGQGMNGLMGPMAMAAIPQVSSVWFPPHERVTATSISNSFCIFGYGVAFLLGPAFVSEIREPGPIHNGSTNHTTMLPGDFSHAYDNATVLKARTEIMRYMYLECSWSWFLFLIVLIYFPAAPPHPPGLSAVAARESYWGGLWSLKGKLGFLLVAFSYGISTGVTAGWLAMLTVNLKPFHVDQDASAWIGFYSISGSCILSLLVCRFVDHFIRYIKVFIVTMYSFGSIALILFALITVQVIPFTQGLTFFTVIAGFTLTNGAIPLLFELACELAYPTSESAANGVLTFLNNLFCLFFLLVLSVPDLNTRWEHWTVVGCCFICVPLIGLLKSRFNRLDLDEAAPILEETIVSSVGIEGPLNHAELSSAGNEA